MLLTTLNGAFISFGGADRTQRALVRPI